MVEKITRGEFDCAGAWPEPSPDPEEFGFEFVLLFSDDGLSGFESVGRGRGEVDGGRSIDIQ